MQRLWYYELDGCESGPIASGALDDLVREGTLSTTTRIREANSEHWSRFSRLQDTIRRDATTQPAPPPASLVGAASPNSSVAEQFTSIDSINVSGNDDATEEDLRRTAAETQFTSIDSINISGDDEAAGAGAQQTAARTLYFCKSFGEVMGPMPHRELVMLAGTGIITRDDEVRKDSETAWVPAGELPEIAEALAAHAALGSGMDDSATLTSAGDETDPDEIDQVTEPHDGADSRDAASAGGNGKGPQQRRRKPLTARERKRRARIAAARQRRLDEENRLEEVFSEAFSDGEAPAPPASPEVPAAAAAPPSPVTPPTAPFAAPAPAPTAPAQPAEPHNPVAAATAAVRPPAAQFTPPPRPKKSGGGAGGLKTPVMIGAAVLLLAVGGWGLTQVELGSVFGVDVEEVLTSYQMEYDKLSQGAISPTDWSAFADAVRADVKVAINQLKDGGAPEGRDMELLKAATALVQMVNVKVDDEDKRLEFYEQFKSAMQAAG